MTDTDTKFSIWQLEERLNEQRRYFQEQLNELHREFHELEERMAQEEILRRVLSGRVDRREYDR